jgi:hypothetical protein
LAKRRVELHGDRRRSPRDRLFRRDPRKAAADLVAKRFLLPDDAGLLLGRAESEGITSTPVGRPAKSL